MASVAPLDRLKAALAERYRVERALGAGGMATVYLARDLRHDREVAVKVLRPELAAMLGADRFLREIRITAALDHPHILTLIDSGETDGFLWYVLPFVRGESLRDRFNREGQLPLDDALAITRQIAGALDYAHRQGVIHRDIKPENVLLFEGEAMLADFGIALAVGAVAGTRLTESGLSLGTPQYMSPEQATGTRQLDGRSDVYSLGAVVYEMLAGEPPHSGPSAQAVIGKLLTDRPTSLRTVRDTVPEAVEAAVAKALAKVPADRFTSAGAFAAALATEKPAAKRRVSRRVVAAGLGLAAIAAFVALVVRYVVLRSGGALVPNRVVVTVFENQTGDTSLSTLGRIAADWITDGMLRAEIFEVTPTQVALRAWRFVQDEERAGRARDPVRALAQETGAGLVISGSFLRRGDSLSLQAEITDARRGRVISPELRVTGSALDPVRAVDLLRARVMGAATAALQRRPPLGLVGISSHSPTFPAYQAFMDGVELFLRADWPGSAERFYRAAALDTMFLVPMLWAGVAELNRGQNWRVDSIARVLTSAEGRMSRFEKYHLEYIRAAARADWKIAQIANQGLSRILPQSGYTFNVGVWAYFLNRPREGIQWLRKLDPERGPMRDWPFYGVFLTQMHHVLADYGAELGAARRGRTLFPDLPATLWPEVRVRAARGDYQRAAALLEERLNFRAGREGHTSRSWRTRRGNSPRTGIRITPTACAVAQSTLTEHSPLGCRPRSGREGMWPGCISAPVNGKKRRSSSARCFTRRRPASSSRGSWA